MTQTQFLLFLISIIPLINCLIIKMCDESPVLVSAANRFMPILFLINLIGLCGNLKNDNSYLVITEAMRGVSLGFVVDQISLGFLFILNFFWLIFAFYSHRFLSFIEAKNSDNLKFFFTLTIAFINLIILSKNLLSTLFFYNCLILLSYFFALKFLHKKETKFSRFFTLLLYLESVFFFLAIVATYKFTDQIDFVNGGVVAQNFDATKHSLLFFLYFSGLFLSVLLPSYLLYRDINLDPLVIYIFFFLAYAFSGLYIFLKLIVFVFGLQGFSLIIQKIGFGFFEAMFLLNMIAASVFLLLSRGFKSSFFYLFFHQFIFTLFAIILFVTFDGSRFYLTLFSFLFSFTLVFLTISNFILYLGKAEDKSLVGLFYDFIITTSLLIFALANMIGIAPAIGAVEKFFLLKIIIQKKLWLSAAIFLVNFITLALFSWKMLYPLFLRKEKSDKNELAKDIDFDSSLILTGLTVAVIMFLGLILFPFIINLFT